jgi:hypothetical protein
MLTRRRCIRVLGWFKIYELAVLTDTGQPTTMQQLAGSTRVDLRCGGYPHALGLGAATIAMTVGTVGDGGSNCRSAHPNRTADRSGL